MKTLLLLLLSVSAFAADPVLPDAKLTPGVVRDYGTVASLVSTKTATVRNVPEKEKRAVFVEYFGAVPAKPGVYEIDHLISLELGGSNDIKNLWPQSYVTQPWNSHVKDKLEDWMAASVRHELNSRGEALANLLLVSYQKEISSNWILAYTKYFGNLTPGATQP